MVHGKHDMDRRSLLGGLAAGVAASGAALAAGVAAPAQAAERSGPRAVHVYDAVALLEETVPHGTTPIGQRFRVPIIGGTFEGPDLRGRILPGGFDWQLMRADGYLELVADYFMETDDKVLIQVTNRGLLHLASPGGPATYVMSTPRFEAPMGKYGWLNQFIFTGTVAPGAGPKPSVQLSIFKLI
jgi:hypothetical protein